MLKGTAKSQGGEEYPAQN